MPHHYHAYSLTLGAALPLPLPAAEPAVPQVVVRRGRAGRPAHTLLADGSLFAVSAAGAYVAWEGVGACLVRAGREIVVEQAPGGDPAALTLLILGPALTLLLQQRGLIVLHGSVVGFDGGAVVFLGDSGAGKSTLAAALGRRGRQVLADDLAVIRLPAPVRDPSPLAGEERGPAGGRPAGAGDAPLVLPGPPQLRLLPDVLQALGLDPAAIPPIQPGLAKHGLAIAGHAAALPLRQVYLLAEGPELCSAPLPPREAFLALARHYYCYPVALLQATGDEARLLGCATLAGRVPVRRLRKHPPLAELARLELLIAGQLDHERAVAAQESLHDD